jgi:hypothetical protein
LDEPGIISGIVELDAKDGSAKWMANHGDWVYLHRQQPLIVIQDRCNRVVRILDEKNEVGSIPMVHFAIIDVDFGKEMIALAEGEKGVRILDHRGALLSHYAPKGRKPNCIGVAFDEDRLIVFDSWDGSFVTIIDPCTGKLIAEYEREFHDDICFIDDGSRFVDSSGQICRSNDGCLITTVKAEQRSTEQPRVRHSASMARLFARGCQWILIVGRVQRGIGIRNVKLCCPMTAERFNA